MGLLNKQYRPYILMTIAGVMFAICLFVFKPAIKMAELYTLFARVQPDTLKPILDFGAEHFVLSNVVPAIPSLELANLPLIADIGLCGLTVFLTTFVSIVIPNISNDSNNFLLNSIAFSPTPAVITMASQPFISK